MFSFAFRNLRTRPVRSLLALCGLTVAIGGMVGLFSVAGGIEAMVTSTFARIPGLAVMQPGAPIPLFSRLPASWGEEIRRVPGVHVVQPEVWLRAHIIEGKPIVAPPRFLFGNDIDINLQLRHGVYRGAVTEGRFLTSADRGTLNVVVSKVIAEEFHKNVGDTLNVDGLPLKIVGIYFFGSQLLDVAIFMDIDRVRAFARMGSDSVCNFYVEPEPNADREQLAKDIRELFRGRAMEAWQPTSALSMALPATVSPANPLSIVISALGKALQPTSEHVPDITQPPEVGASEKTKSKELAVEVRSPEDWTQEFKRFSADLDIFLMIMTSIGVTIAVLGIVNTMLMSVTERFIEFGILKANGWSNFDVLKLIAFESALLGLCGGVLGSALGWAVTQFVNANWPSRIHLHSSPQLLFFSLCFSTGVGLLGGLYPAWWASRMLPMDAIRRG